MNYKPASTICSRCPNERRPKGRLCSVCHAADMRAFRKNHMYVKIPKQRRAKVTR